MIILLQNKMKIYNKQYKHNKKANKDLKQRSYKEKDNNRTINIKFLQNYYKKLIKYRNKNKIYKINQNKLINSFLKDK